jgi:hypothetical protein
MAACLKSFTKSRLLTPVKGLGIEIAPRADHNMTSSKSAMTGTVLQGGTSKAASRIAPLLSEADCLTLGRCLATAGLSSRR